MIGPDWRAFLQGLLSQDVETLAPGELRFGALLTPQGKLLFDLFILGRDDGCWLDVAADRREALIQRLTSTSCAPRSRSPPSRRRSGAVGRRARRAGPPIRGCRRSGARGYGVGAAAAARPAEEAAYDAMRLALGVPDPARDCPPRPTYPIEANFDLLNGIDFQKGCFVGQETTSRMKRRGAIKTRMLPITFEGPPPRLRRRGAGREPARRRGAQRRRGRAMALLRLDRIAGAALTVDGRAVSGGATPAYFRRKAPV